MKEVDQPTIALPDKKDPLKWALYGRIHNQWIRHVAPQLNLDTQKLLLGDVLSSIVGDDANAISFYIPDLISDAKASLLERLDWEIGAPELPEDFRNRLKEVHVTISEIDWSSEENWQKAKSIWTDAKDWIKEEIDKKPELVEALEYDIEVSKLLSPYYDKFLYGDVAVK